MEENKDVQSSKGKKKGNLLKLIIALVVIGAIGAVVVLGAQGGWFQGFSFRGKLKTPTSIEKVTPIQKTVAPIEKKFDAVDKHVMIDKELSVKELDKVNIVTKEINNAMIEKEMIAKEADKLAIENFDKELLTIVDKEDSDFNMVVTEPKIAMLVPGKPTVKITFLDHTGGGFVDDSIYGQQTPHPNDVMMAFKVEVVGDAGAWVELDELQLTSIDPHGASHGSTANFQFGRFGKLVRLNYTGSTVSNVTLIAEHVFFEGDAGADTFEASEFVNRSWTRVNVGEEKVFAILWDSAGSIPLIMGSYSDITGSSLINGIKFVDQGNNIHNVTDVFVVGSPNQTIRFK